VEANEMPIVGEIGDCLDVFATLTHNRISYAQRTGHRKSLCAGELLAMTAVAYKRSLGEKRKEEK
jgi:hypothetical protein